MDELLPSSGPGFTPRIVNPAFFRFQCFLVDPEFFPGFTELAGRHRPEESKALKSKPQLVVDGGYVKLKGKTFCISNMGDETDETIASMLKSFDAELAKTPTVAAA